MQALKSFVDGQGRRIKPGIALPTDYDRETLAHYERHGMVGATDKASKADKGLKVDKSLTKTPGPAEKRPAGPAEKKPAAPVQTLPASPSEGQVAAPESANDPLKLGEPAQGE